MQPAERPPLAITGYDAYNANIITPKDSGGRANGSIAFPSTSTLILLNIALHVLVRV